MKHAFYLWLLALLITVVVSGSIALEAAPVQAAPLAAGQSYSMTARVTCTWPWQEHCQWIAVNLTFNPKGTCYTIKDRWGNTLQSYLKQYGYTQSIDNYLTLDESHGTYHTYGWGVPTRMTFDSAYKTWPLWGWTFTRC